MRSLDSVFPRYRVEVRGRVRTTKMAELKRRNRHVTWAHAEITRNVMYKPAKVSFQAWFHCRSLSQEAAERRGRNLAKGLATDVSVHAAKVPSQG